MTPDAKGASAVMHSSFNIDKFSGDIQAMVAGKMSTSDLARMRVCPSLWKITASAKETYLPHPAGTKGLIIYLQAVNKSWKAIADLPEVSLSTQRLVTHAWLTFMHCCSC